MNSCAYGAQLNFDDLTKWWSINYPNFPGILNGTELRTDFVAHILHIVKSNGEQPKGKIQGKFKTCVFYNLQRGKQYNSLQVNKRHRDRRPIKAAGPGCWAMGANKAKKCAVRKIILCTGLTIAAKAGQISFVPARRVQQTNQGRASFIWTFWVTFHLSFNLVSTVNGAFPL